MMSTTVHARHMGRAAFHVDDAQPINADAPRVVVVTGPVQLTFTPIEARQLSRALDRASKRAERSEPRAVAVDARE